MVRSSSVDEGCAPSRAVEMAPIVCWAWEGCRGSRRVYRRWSIDSGSRDEASKLIGLNVVPDPDIVEGEVRTLEMGKTAVTGQTGRLMSVR